MDPNDGRYGYSNYQMQGGPHGLPHSVAIHSLPPQRGPNMYTQQIYTNGGNVMRPTPGISSRVHPTMTPTSHIPINSNINMGPTSRVQPVQRPTVPNSGGPPNNNQMRTINMHPQVAMSRMIPSQMTRNGPSSQTMMSYPEQTIGMKAAAAAAATTTTFPQEKAGMKIVESHHRYKLDPPRSLIPDEQYNHMQQQQQQQARSFNFAQDFVQNNAAAIGSYKYSAQGSDTDARFGLMGLLDVIRQTNQHLTTLALGTDLTTLGLNLTSPEDLYATFYSPFLDGSRKEKNSSFLPDCYTVQDLGEPSSKIDAYTEDTLFYIFYAMPKDTIQLLAHEKLCLPIKSEKNNWKFSDEQQCWTKTTDESQIFFDPVNWKRIQVDLKK